MRMHKLPLLLKEFQSCEKNVRRDSTEDADNIEQLFLTRKVLQIDAAWMIVVRLRVIETMLSSLKDAIE